MTTIHAAWAQRTRGLVWVRSSPIVHPGSIRDTLIAVPVCVSFWFAQQTRGGRMENAWGVVVYGEDLLSTERRNATSCGSEQPMKPTAN